MNGSTQEYNLITAGQLKTVSDDLRNYFNFILSRRP